MASPYKYFEWYGSLILLTRISCFGQEGILSSIHWVAGKVSEASEEQAS